MSSSLPHPPHHKPTQLYYSGLHLTREQLIFQSEQDQDLFQAAHRLARPLDRLRSICTDSSTLPTMRLPSLPLNLHLPVRASALHVHGTSGDGNDIQEQQQHEGRDGEQEDAQPHDRTPHMEDTPHSPVVSHRFPTVLSRPFHAASTPEGIPVISVGHLDQDADLDALARELDRLAHLTSPNLSADTSMFSGPAVANPTGQSPSSMLVPLPARYEAEEDRIPTPSTSTHFDNSVDGNAGQTTSACQPLNNPKSPVSFQEPAEVAVLSDTARGRRRIAEKGRMTLAQALELQTISDELPMAMKAAASASSYTNGRSRDRPSEVPNSHSPSRPRLKHRTSDFSSKAHEILRTAHSIGGLRHPLHGSYRSHSAPTSPLSESTLSYPANSQAGAFAINDWLDGWKEKQQDRKPAETGVFDARFVAARAQKKKTLAHINTGHSHTILPTAAHSTSIEEPLHDSQYYEDIDAEVSQILALPPLSPSSQSGSLYTPSSASFPYSPASARFSAYSAYPSSGSTSVRTPSSASRDSRRSLDTRLADSLATKESTDGVLDGGDEVNHKARHGTISSASIGTGGPGRVRFVET